MGMAAKLLVVDDDQEMVEFLTDELTQQGFQVTSRRSGGDAIIAVVDNRYDLVLMDMLMPGMDGLQTIHVIRKISPQTPIIGLTGYVGRGYMSQASSYGVTCLSKPVSVTDLVREIKETLNGQKNKVY
jgi:CheY-like chemotaxis protein